MPITPKEIGWVAGIVEGEGYIATPKDKRYNSSTVRVIVNMTDRDVIERLAKTVHGHVLGPYQEKRFKAKDQYRVAIYGSHAAALLMTIYPLMGIRRQSKIREVLTTWRKTKVIRPRDKEGKYAKGI